MGFFSNLFGRKKPNTVLAAPVKGRLTGIEGVSDEIFAQKILGDGVAIIPSEGMIYAPCDGSIDNMFETGHAFSIVSEDGAEVLIHVGFDTVKLKGKHFKVLKDTGDRVKKGDLLLEVNLQAVSALGFDTTVVMVILNTDDYSGFHKADGETEAGAEVLTLTGK